MTEELEQGFDRFREDMIASCRKGMGQAGLRLLGDSVMQSPTVPKDEGTLRASGSVHVDGEPTMTSAELGIRAPDATPVDQPITPETAGVEGITATVGFNTPYAAYQHRGMRADGSHVVENYTEPSSGPNFVGAKIEIRGEQYLQLARDVAAKEMKNRGW